MQDPLDDTNLFDNLHPSHVENSRIWGIVSLKSNKELKSENLKLIVLNFFVGYERFQLEFQFFTKNLPVRAHHIFENQTIHGFYLYLFNDNKI